MFRVLSLHIYIIKHVLQNCILYNFISRLWYICIYINRLESNKDVADIKLSQHLDYESNTQYSLIVRVQNKYQLAAETVIDIEVLDVNDNIPVFRDIKKGSVLENEPRGVPVMQVRAIDADGTSANNQVLKLSKWYFML